MYDEYKRKSRNKKQKLKQKEWSRKETLKINPEKSPEGKV